MQFCDRDDLPLTTLNSEQLDDIERSLLGLDVPDDEVVPGPSIPPSRSPKRSRTTARSESPPNKRRRSNRKNPTKIVRDRVLESLTSRRKSKSKSSKDEDVSKSQQRRKPKKPRRLPVDELVTVSQRFDGSDLEDSDSKYQIA